MHLLHHKHKGHEPPTYFEVPRNGLSELAASSEYEAPPAYENDTGKSTTTDAEKKLGLENGEKPKRKHDHSYKM
jgi:hypothetical protein